MAKKRKPARKKEWVEQAVVVKKTHPFAKTKEEAELIAEHHSKHKGRETLENPRGYRIIERPKTCFTAFRGQKRGEHVTVFWGKLKVGALKKSACR